MSLSEREGIELARLLRKMEWPVSREVFYALTPQILTVPIELGVFNQERKLLMLPRPDNDPEFPAGALHIPGTLLWADDGIESGMARLLSKEVTVPVTKPLALGYLHTTRKLAPTRPAMALLFATRLQKTYMGRGQFYDPHMLPEQTLPHHREIIATIMSRLPPDFFLD